MDQRKARINFTHVRRGQTLEQRAIEQNQEHHSVKGTTDAVYLGAG